MSLVFSEEAQAALKDIAVGVEKSNIKCANDDEAILEIQTFEGITLELLLNVHGYEIQFSSKEELLGKRFESIQTLMSEISPDYREKFSSALFAKLESSKHASM
eukprot:m.158026 g.158026  ORF g.158026 m.158026 type:complete len:104 (-) comp15125_c0_seq1:1242-1553(-)